jgi:hypothetical protein
MRTSDRFRLALDVFDKGLGNVHGIDFSFWGDERGKEAGEEAGAGTDIGHDHSRFQADGFDNLESMVVGITAIALEPWNELREGRIFELLVNARVDAFLLGLAGRSQNQQREDDDRRLRQQCSLHSQKLRGTVLLTGRGGGSLPSHQQIM